MANGMTDKEGKFELRGTHADGFGETDTRGRKLPNPYLQNYNNCGVSFVSTKSMYDKCVCIRI
jgi:hypothetical protein